MTVLVVAVLLAGCTIQSSDATISFSSNVPRDHESQANAECREQGELTITMGGLRAGSMRLRVFDASGDTLFDETYLGNEGGDDARSLFGQAGEWTLQMDGTLVEGKASARLSC